MKSFAAFTAAVFAIVTFAAPLTAPVHAKQSAPSLSIPVSGTGGGSTLAGTFDLQKFVVSNGVVNAVGTLTGTVTNASGQAVSIVRTLTIPVAVGETSCAILHLELGPVFLDLLGLQVSLNQIVLDIDAQPGPGNLPGNLLCAVAGLLDNPGGLARLLNDLLAILG